jgi:hypothetical protein
MIGWLREDVASDLKFLMVGLGYDYAQPATDSDYDNIAKAQSDVAAALTDVWRVNRATKANGVTYEYSAIHEVHYDKDGLDVVGGWLGDQVLTNESLSDAVSITQYTFGNKSGLDQTTGHKDTWIAESAKGASFAQTDSIGVRNYTASSRSAVSLLRFDFGSVLPAGFVVGSATLHLFLKSNDSNAQINVHGMITDWGKTATDEGAGSATGAPSWDNSIDWNDGRDVAWASGEWSSSDYDADRLTFFLSPSTDSAGTEYKIIADGNIGAKGRGAVEALRQMARYQNMKQITVADIVGTELLIETDYAGFELVNVCNDTASDGVVSVKTRASGGATATAVDVPVAAGQTAPFVLPPIYSIVKADTTCTTLILLFQKLA